MLKIVANVACNFLSGVVVHDRRFVSLHFINDIMIGKMAIAIGV